MHFSGGSCDVNAAVEPWEVWTCCFDWCLGYSWTGFLPILFRKDINQRLGGCTTHVELLIWTEKGGWVTKPVVKSRFSRESASVAVPLVTYETTSLIWGIFFFLHSARCSSTLKMFCVSGMKVWSWFLFGGCEAPPLEGTGRFWMSHQAVNLTWACFFINGGLSLHTDAIQLTHYILGFNVIAPILWSKQKKDGRTDGTMNKRIIAQNSKYSCGWLTLFQHTTK